ncbi:hypothetical protein BKA70DRAFT_737395 [Coprinopsis sp. MPI-PUGE-AT-0042]|nr:hypothetical protein BKA70DRAFT_737395 [Coprinopsis sp. MPI-PUGE-AT-0042]
MTQSQVYPHRAAPSVPFRPTLSPLPPVHATNGSTRSCTPVKPPANPVPSSSRAPLELSDEPSIGHVKGRSMWIAFALRIPVPRFATSPRNFYSPRLQEREPQDTIARARTTAGANAGNRVIAMNGIRVPQLPTPMTLLHHSSARADMYLSSYPHRPESSGVDSGKAHDERLRRRTTWRN